MLFKIVSYLFTKWSHCQTIKYYKIKFILTIICIVWCIAWYHTCRSHVTLPYKLQLITQAHISNAFYNKWRNIYGYANLYTQKIEKNQVLGSWSRFLFQRNVYIVPLLTVKYMPTVLGRGHRKIIWVAWKKVTPFLKFEGPLG